MAYSRRREMAGLAEEPPLAPGWGLSLLLRCTVRPDSARVNLPSQATNSCPLWSPADSEELIGQKPHWPGSRSCLQRAVLLPAVIDAADGLIAPPLVFGCMTWNS